MQFPVSIKSVYTYSLGILVLFSAVSASAQRFGHGGGGGFHGGGGFGGGRPAAPPARSYSPPARSYSPPAREERHRDDRGSGRSFFTPDRGIRRNENAYHNYYERHAYNYHPYRPYVWGARWHPVGYFLTALAADAFYFTLAGQPYYYDYGVYYMPSGNGYAVCPPPVGAIVSYLPDGYTTVPLGDDVYYYFGGAFYISVDRGYQVVVAPIGAIVYQIPDGANEQVINGETYLLYNNTYFLPISQNGQDAYEVVQLN